MSDDDMRMRPYMAYNHDSNFIERDVAVKLAGVVLENSHDYEDAKELLSMLLGPLKIWHTCPTCGRRYETNDDYQKFCGKRDTWHTYALDAPDIR